MKQVRGIRNSGWGVVTILHEVIEGDVGGKTGGGEGGIWGRASGQGKGPAQSPGGRRVPCV